jgi:hypothetical protein
MTLFDLRIHGLIRMIDHLVEVQILDLIALPANARRISSISTCCGSYLISSSIAYVRVTTKQKNNTPSRLQQLFNHQFIEMPISDSHIITE